MTRLEKGSKRNRRPAWLRAGLFAVLLLAVSDPASASATFPGVILEKYEKDGMTCPPQCTVCHTSPYGGQPTATQPFALTLLSLTKTLGPIGPDVLPKFLDHIEKDPCPNSKDPTCAAGQPCSGPCNANGKGEPDILALKAGKNPNDDTPLDCPGYGCGAHIAPTEPTHPIDGTAALTALGVAVVLAGRWRRR